ncbi:magnesium transporter MgtE [Thermoclostridium stercorarium subsp. stercorarium DSM 8532]|jgi:magnesium transporter|uniref:Magnesium transporter MgtE n=3 Tax=Thermoclostridium stercorarium TaxID=1510 RepID=L7VQK2_THES1|nr:magnesium transporter [Thermoclostridium stercorarium]AGC68964.1 magnesium transporter MgtE [Thermoclostridium stercorarium subsp. stercorarium DSM 8532]AGI39945.1 MgtE [Thermoclostridium stercorarium subsp. stercorarium DSM 8532]ANW99266.1 magnesium transporter [Thermoclostridium stercorarium subsp. thermolacticum DSM 2910]ANX01894.1 magnesium transporter [Thermoclostridium stercorarium subsp. leptospartum DSM 9219]UZQ84939.1 magnesium transporter [Thermoclostridium stercorarium]
MKELILNLIDSGNYSEARKKLIEMNEVDIAQLLEELDKQKLLIIFRILPKEIAAGVFSYISNQLQEYIIASITDREIKNIIDELFLDDTIDFLEEMPSNIVKRVLQATDDETRKLINQFLKYPEDSAGSIMTIEYVDLKKEMTVKQALEHIKETGVDKETIDTCYVLNENRILEGVIPIRKLILSDETTVVKDIMDTDPVYVNTHDDQEKIASLFKKYDLISMPVVDNERRLVGIVTIDDVVDIIDQENTEDFQKMAAMHPSDEEYLKTSPWVLAKHRITWLVILMISAAFTGNIINKYNNILQSIVILTSFIPMLMDTGGNAGSQSSTLIIRGLALGEITTRDIFRVILKEVQVSFICGFVLAALNFIRIYFLEKINLLVTLTVCVTLFFTVMLAKIIGCVLPILAKMLKVDPAIMASPLLTTIVDATSLMIYFTFATWILHI